MHLPQYASKHCELVHNFIAFSSTPKGNIMSKELNIIDTLAIDQSEVAVATDISELNDLCLALVGGGNVIVDLG